MKADQIKSITKKSDESIGNTILNTKVKSVANILLYSVLIPGIIYCSFYLFIKYQPHFIETEIKEVSVYEKRPVYWVYARDPDRGYLKHVFAVLDRLGFERGTNESEWDLLWAHDYPFTQLYTSLSNLKSHQKVNHFPGCGYITNKVDLSTTVGKYIPISFRIPDDKQALLDYVAEQPDKIFVQKSNAHRNIKIEKFENLNLSSSESFIQEFVDKPFLVDGYKFDIGIYTVITSIDPLRLYVYKGDVLFRFCPVKYYPFDAEILDKYVVGDDYLPIWNVPSLKNYYTKLGFSMKDSFDAYAISKGKDPKKMWNDVFDAIKDMVLQKESLIRESLKRYQGKRNFFEMVRFDFILDEDLNVYMLEANMSPNLSSAHYPPNQLLYEQVLYNLFSLLGVGQRMRKDSLQQRNAEEKEMIVANKNLAVLPEMCAECDDCFRVECQLCKPCFTDEVKSILEQSYWEHQNKMDYLRIFPPPITPNMTMKDYTLKNQLLIRWFQGKCEIDSTWCG